MSRPRFIRPIHAFRGFAIGNVVLLHAAIGAIWVVGGPQRVAWLQTYNHMLEIGLRGATLYFAMISGLLFPLVLEQRGYLSFYRSKLANVLMPFVLMTLLLTWYHQTFTGEGSRLLGFGHYLDLAGSNLLTGGAVYTFWYIPVLFCLYLLTPFVVQLERTVLGRALLIAFALLPLVVSRRWPEWSWTNVPYFGGAYALGILIGRNYDAVIARLSARLGWLVLTCTLATSVLTYITFTGSYDVLGISVRESAYYAQKVLLGLLVLALFHKFEDHLPAKLDTLGTYAFPIYFAHATVLSVFDAWARAWIGGTSALWVVPVLGALNAIVVLLLLPLAARFLQKHLGKRSRLLIGA